MLARITKALTCPICEHAQNEIIYENDKFAGSVNRVLALLKIINRIN